VVRLLKIGSHSPANAVVAPTAPHSPRALAGRLPWMVRATCQSWRCSKKLIFAGRCRLRTNRQVLVRIGTFCKVVLQIAAWTCRRWPQRRHVSSHVGYATRGASVPTASMRRWPARLSGACFFIQYKPPLHRAPLKGGATDATLGWSRCIYDATLNATDATQLKKKRSFKGVLGFRKSQNATGYATPLICSVAFAVAWLWFFQSDATVSQQRSPVAPTVSLSSNSVTARLKRDRSVGSLISGSLILTSA
jgi:hypothetical protein